MYRFMLTLALAAGAIQAGPSLGRAVEQIVQPSPERVALMRDQARELGVQLRESVAQRRDDELPKYWWR